MSANPYATNPYKRRLKKIKDNSGADSESTEPTPDEEDSEQDSSNTTEDSNAPQRKKKLSASSFSGAVKRRLSG